MADQAEEVRKKPALDDDKDHEVTRMQDQIDTLTLHGAGSGGGHHHHHHGTPEYASASSDASSVLEEEEEEEEAVFGEEEDNSEEDNSEEDDEDDEEEEEEDNSEEETSWISWFCSLRENEFLCEVDEDYIEDDFNLTGLNSIVPYYDYALDMILDIENPNDENFTQIQQEMIESAAEMLYGLIHSRYILTTKGMAAMLHKYQNVDFGRCHRVYCQGQPVLPVGQSDVPRHTTVNVYCPKCRDIFFPKSHRAAQIDGAYFGTTFAHVFLMTYSHLVPPPPTQQYVPRIYGYKIHETSEYYTGKKPNANSSGATSDRNQQQHQQKNRSRKKLTMSSR